VLQHLSKILDKYPMDIFGTEVVWILCGGVFDFWRNWDSNRADSPLDLLDLLILSRDTFTSQPADKVYALLSLASDAEQVKVDYRKNPREIFIDVASRFVVDYPALILHCASNNIWDDLRGLPSWVPDWTRTEITGTPHEDSEEHIIEAMKQERNANPVRVEGEVLLTEMLEIDEVRIVGLPWPGCQKIEKNVALNPRVRDLGYKAFVRLVEWHRMLDQLEDNAGDAYGPTGESRLTAFMRTLVAGQLDETDLDEPYSSWDSVFAKLKDQSLRLHHQSLGSYYDNAVNRSDLSGINWALKTLCERKTFFLTKKGRMGLGPAFILPFDRIYARRRTFSPIIIRKTTRRRHRLIGDCYLHGWDRSELMENAGEWIMIE
jgi:hypothetical protein